MLVVDTIWGPQKGLGHPVIWWLPEAAASQDALSERIPEEGTKLVKCPRRLRNFEALRAEFGPELVLQHTWAVPAAVTECARQ